MGGASEIRDVKMFTTHSDKYLEYNYYGCGSGWGRKCLQLGRDEPAGGGLRVFALHPSAQPAACCQV